MAFLMCQNKVEASYRQHINPHSPRGRFCKCPGFVGSKPACCMTYPQSHNCYVEKSGLDLGSQAPDSDGSCEMRSV